MLLQLLNSFYEILWHKVFHVNLNLISLKDVLELINSKPQNVDLVLTGNYAKDEVIEAADLVTEMREIKHPFQQGIKAKEGIDF